MSQKSEVTTVRMCNIVVCHDITAGVVNIVFMVIAGHEVLQ